jgi:hypothetical protein
MQMGNQSTTRISETPSKASLRALNSQWFCTKAEIAEMNEATAGELVDDVHVDALLEKKIQIERKIASARSADRAELMDKFTVLESLVLEERTVGESREGTHFLLLDSIKLDVSNLLRA